MLNLPEIDFWTAIGLSIGVASLVLAILIYNRQKEAQKIAEDESKKTLEYLKQYTESSFKTLAGLYLDRIRTFAESGSKSSAKYWDFVWKFEKWNTLELNIKKEDEIVFSVDVKILGKAKDFRDNELQDTILFDYYICEVISSSHDNLFKLNSKVCCFYFAKKIWISEFEPDIATFKDMYEVDFISIGGFNLLSNKKERIEDVKVYERIKDFKIK